MIIELLFDRGANIYAKNDELLRFAETNSYKDTVELLLDRGANIHAENNEELKLAIYRDCKLIIE